MEREKEGGEKHRYLEAIKVLRERDKIEGIVFDLDGTLLDDSIMNYQKFKAKEIFCTGVEASTIKKIEIYESFEKISRHSLIKFENTPIRWEWVLTQLQDHYGSLESRLRDAFLESLNTIYETVMPVYPRVKEFLSWSQEAGLLIGINSLSSPKWGFDKLKSSGLDLYVDYTNFIVKGLKGRDSWIETALQMGIYPSALIGVGDRLVEDAMSSKDAGYNYSVLVTPKREPGEVVIYNPSLVKGIKILEGIETFPEFIGRLAA